MMIEEREIEHLNSMLAAIIYASNFVKNLSEEEFLTDKKTIYAVTRCLEIISLKAIQIQRLHRAVSRQDRHLLSSNKRLRLEQMTRLNRVINQPYKELPPGILWETLQKDLSDLEEQLRSILGEHIHSDIPDHLPKLTKVRLIFDRGETQKMLTSALLSHEITPYLTAISELQRIISSIKGQPIPEVSIKSLSQNSPISVSLDGAAEATEVIRDIVVPWRREHGKEIAELEKQEKLVQIESTKAEILEIRARAQKERIEAKTLEIEAQVEIERKHLENEKLRLEIEEARINLALKILDKLSPELTQEQKILYVMQLLKPLGVLANSPMLLDSEGS